jgi:uracil-DNA glycosylase family 4
MEVIRQSDVNKALEGRLKPEDIAPHAKAAKDAAINTMNMIHFLNKEKCTHCLYKDCSMSVLPQGPVSSPFMIIADVPGEYDMFTRTPLFDAGGRYLFAMLGRLGISRDTVYITNGIKCRNGNFVNEEAHYLCFCNYLLQELVAVRPNVVLVLGEMNSRVARDFLTGEQPDASKNIETFRNTVTNVDFNGLKFEMHHTYDPSVVLAKVGSLYDRYKLELWKDLLKVTNRVKELNPGYQFTRR